MRADPVRTAAALAATFIVVLGTASGTASSAVPGPVAAYSFDEGAGSAVADASGNGNAGTVDGAAWTEGRFGSALEFDGSGDVVIVPDSASLDVSTGMTLEAWVKPTAVVSWSTVLAKERGSDFVYGVRANTSSPALSAEIYAGNPRMARAATPLPVGAWTHVAATFDGAVLRLFANGIQIGTRSVSEPLPATAGALRIGGAASEWFRGSIDEVRIYDRALSAAEIATDMATPVFVPDTTPPSSPGALRVTETTETSVALAWDPATDDRAVAGYELYRDGSGVGSTTGTTQTFGALACGTTYVMGIDAFDEAGNRSPQSSLSATTSPCPVVVPTAALYVSSTGSDTAPCTQTEPCASIDRAYDLAAPGDIVELADGAYPVQVVDGTKAAPSVLVRPAAGAHVSLAELGVRADQLEIRDVAVPGGVAVRGESDFATLRNLDLGGRLYIAGPRDLTIVGGDVGPYLDGPSWITHEDGIAPQRVVIEGVHFHDFTVSSPGVHTECMLVVAGDGIVFRGNRWTNCSVFDLSFGWCCSSPAPPTNVLIENNFFGRPAHGGTTTLHFNTNLDPVAGYTIRNNSSDGAFVLDQGQLTFGDVRAVGNALTGSTCGRVAWSSNIFVGSTCAGDGNALVADLGFVDPAAGDLHRTATSPLADAGSPLDFPATDFDGEARPMGAAPDAGADER